VDGGKITAIDAHPGNQATPEGPCLKGLSYLERVYSPDRLVEPMLREGPGRYRAVAWEEALDLMAERFGAIAREHGPQAVMYYAGSGTKGMLNSAGMTFWRRFGGCTTTYGDLCWPAGLEATRLTLGDNRHNSPWDLARAALIVLWGKNAAETNVHQMRFVDQALAAGGKVVVIDPRRTGTAEKAALLIQPRPGTDGALALGLAHVLVRDGLVDRGFVDAHVLGFEAYAASLVPWTPQRAEAVTGVPAAAIEALARDLGTIKPLTICAGFGMQRYTNSGQTMRALLSLLALTGNIGRPGAGWVYANLQADVFSSVKDPLDFYPPETPDGVVRVSLSTARLGRDMAAQADPPLKAAWVERGNPLGQNPETHKVREAFRALDFRVVVDERFTDTALEADLVLPSKSLFEQTDVIGAYWHPYLQLRPRLVDPPGQVRPETEIYWHLARRLGLSTEGFVPPGGEEAWLEAKLGRFPDLTLDRLREGPVLAPGHEEVVFQDLCFPTPSGKIELFSEEAARRWGVDPLPAFSEATESRPGAYPLNLLTPNHKNSIHSQFVTLDVIRALDPGPELHLGPGDAEDRGIRQGDRVRVFNDRGELFLPARIDLSLPRGCVVAFNGYGAAHGGSVNLLSQGRETDMGHGAAFHDNLVQVEKRP
jgi:anaerobic selenocysteine-containing dehydrogenase